ncbi:TetR/AcrR family transcriptional regulator [Arthrobacter sp. MYb213]|uniref:TetR/AcrR family transcriptional regulator n=1 Tax=Arthrobacter sp. MYb213 TaxID=1848595 RepID=UPI000CFE044D|nr:TetR/AcrR family transcriptional regulator [Arthrobacter sp. MYb213]PRB66772.1 hypothetical protein CQ011_17130 [Arthrobacter sp. MYb213]
MPKFVEAGDRKRDIIEAAMVVLAEHGFEGLTLRKVGKALGGSTSLVTHYYSTKDELLDDLPGILAVRWQSEIDELLSAADDPADALRRLLLWLIPNTDEKVRAERGRIQFSAVSHRIPSAARVLDRFDHYVRGCFRGLLSDEVPADDMENVIDMLRAVATGIELETVEHKWSSERQEATLKRLVGLLLISV